LLLVTVPSNGISAWQSSYRSPTTVDALTCDIHGKRPSLTCRGPLEIARLFWHCVRNSIHFIIIINNTQHSIWHSETWHLANRGPRKYVEAPQFCTQRRQEKKVCRVRKSNKYRHILEYMSVTTTARYIVSCWKPRLQTHT
jgi:hypothetical protein